MLRRFAADATRRIGRFQAGFDRAGTAARDIQGLIDQGILVKDAAGGRSTSYSLAYV